ncbi:hypothetical protein GYMLUDRAFT_75964 [Collybiopsis luxurians FD-317 M1]|uniref:Cytochrome P450 n=1 Tax=Collybiopsis luxurians FD-317 M1 TaxID=944289 RepID=A0A0D0CFS4_9AGAR|nr:hypothetical protein GYMLUDRAFT_75964 [Collybiopsis luxurians FD-317 M1]
MQYLPQLSLLFVLIVWWIVKRSTKSNRPTQFAHLKPLPGPKGFPFIGNALSMPRAQEHKVFKEWGNIYGDIFKVSVFGRTVVIVNSFDIAIELMEKRGAIYSSRPRLIMAGEWMGFNETYALMPYNDRLRASRRLAHHTLCAQAIKSKANVPEEESERWLRRLLDDPKDWKQSVAEVNGAVTTKIVYGYQTGGKRDPMVHNLEVALHAFSLAIAPGAHLVDFFPSLRKVPFWLFPFKGIKELANHGREALMYGTNSSWAFVENQIAGGIARPSMALDTLDLIKNERNKKTSEDMANVAKWTASATAGGGAHTPVSALMFWILSMVAHPHVQKKAQEELDRVVGRDRLPTLNDRPDLPYIEAVIKEVLRWHPVNPCGIAHATTEDDEYEGMFIAKGTTVILNQWAMLHDPDVYGLDTDKFIPERFLGETPADRVRAGNPWSIAFGFGRRTCPGQNLASLMLFCFISKCLATFNVKRPVDPQTGTEYDPPVDAAPGNVSFPVEFDCTFAVRDQKAVDLISNCAEELVPGDGLPKGWEVPPESHRLAHHW